MLILQSENRPHPHLESISWLVIAAKDRAGDQEQEQEFRKRIERIGCEGCALFGNALPLRLSKPGLESLGLGQESSGSLYMRGQGMR